MNFVYTLPGKRVIRNSSPLKSKFLILTRESSRNPRFAVSTNFSLKILLEFLFYIDVETLIQNPRYKQYFKTTSQLTFEAWKFARREKKGKKDGQERKRIKRTFSSLTRETTNTDYHHNSSAKGLLVRWCSRTGRLEELIISDLDANVISMLAGVVNMACPPLFIRYLPRSINDVSLHMPRSRASQPSPFTQQRTERNREKQRESKGKRGSRGWTEKERALCALLRGWCRRQSQTIQKT